MGKNGTAKGLGISHVEMKRQLDELKAKQVRYREGFPPSPRDVAAGGPRLGCCEGVWMPPTETLRLHAHAPHLDARLDGGQRLFGLWQSKNQLVFFSSSSREAGFNDVDHHLLLLLLLLLLLCHPHRRRHSQLSSKSHKRFRKRPWT